MEWWAVSGRASYSCPGWGRGSEIPSERPTPPSFLPQTHHPVRQKTHSAMLELRGPGTQPSTVSRSDSRARTRCLSIERHGVLFLQVHIHTHTHTHSVQSCLHTVGMQPDFKSATGCMWPLLTWLPCDILGAKTSQPAPGVSDLPGEVCLNSCAAFSAQPSPATTHVHARTAHPQNACSPP